MLLALLVPGCVYYNVFFNAERAYVEAEEGRIQREGRSTTTSPASASSRSGASSQRGSRSGSPRTSRGGEELYRTAIQKSAKVIAYYPESEYVDDALLLMAKSYYRLGEHARSLRKCDELLAGFPGSDLTVETSYWRGMSLWQLGNVDETEMILREIVDDAGSGYRGNVAFALADLLRERGDVEGAIDLYRVAAADADDPVIGGNSRAALGDALIEAGRPGEAVTVYRESADNARTNAGRLDAYVHMANAQRLVGDYEASLGTLEPLLRDERFDRFLARTKVEIGRTHTARGAIEPAILAYQELIDDETRTEMAMRAPGGDDRPISFSPEGYEANYRLGRIHEYHFRNYDRAGQLYETASRGREEVGDSSKARSADIVRWRELHTMLVDTTDSTNLPLRPQTTYRLAEHLYFGFDRPDSARHHFGRLVREYSDSPQAVRAQYAIGWLWLHAEGDTAQAFSVWQALLDDTTDADLANELRQTVQEIIHPRVSAESDPAAPPYERALAAWLDALETNPARPPAAFRDSTEAADWWNDWASRQRETSDDYVARLGAIVETYPESPYATKATYILAWTAENVMQDTAHARSLYREIQADTVIAPAFAARADSILALRLSEERLAMGLPEAESTDTTGALTDSTFTAPADSSALDTETGIPFDPDGGLDEAPFPDRPTPDGSPGRGRRGRGVNLGSDE